MKRYLLLFFLMISISGYAQNTINNYKYVLVPEKFGFLKQNNQYGLNILTKLLLEEKGFQVYLDNTDIPTEIAGNKCKALITDVVEKKGMFTTNLTVLLKDCQGNVLFKSKEGKSREKEYDVSYNAALREAFKSLDDVPYAFQEAKNETVTNAVPVATAPVVPVAAVAAEGKSVTATVASPKAEALAAGTLYAQPTNNGYQLIDTTPKKVLTLLKTSAADYFIAENGKVSGIVLKKGDKWYFEHYEGDQFFSELLLIKF